MDAANSPPVLDIPPATKAQLNRATSLLDHADTVQDANLQFTLCVAALHLARSIPEYWYTVAENIPLELNKVGKEREKLTKRLRQEFESEFKQARRYQMLSDLRQWDFHWEPLFNPMAVGPNLTYGRGAPLRLSTGIAPNSSVAWVGGNRLITSGSGHRVGRANYYQIHKNRFVDHEAGEALPLHLAIREFLEDIPNCVAIIVEKPEVADYIKARS